MSIFTRLIKVILSEILQLGSPPEDITDGTLSTYLDGLLDCKYGSITVNINDPEDLKDYVFPRVRVVKLTGSGLPIDIVCRCFPNLFHLTIFDCKMVSRLDPINSTPGLKYLSIYKSQFKSDTQLKYLDTLIVHSVDLAPNSLKYFSSIRSLKTTNVNNLQNAGLSYLSELREVSVKMSEKDTYHLDELSSLPKLQGIHLDQVSPITALPDLSKNVNFRVVDITMCNKLEDISGMYDVPGLEVVSIVSCGALKPEVFYPLKDHPTLKRVFLGTAPSKQKPLIDLFGDWWWHDRWSNTDFVYILPEIV